MDDKTNIKLMNFGKGLMGKEKLLERERKKRGGDIGGVEHVIHLY